VVVNFVVEDLRTRSGSREKEREKSSFESSLHFDFRVEIKSHLISKKTFDQPWLYCNIALAKYYTQLHEKLPVRT
jgi:hypothetical protein